MEQKKSTSNQETWIKRLDKRLTELGVKQENFLDGKTGVYIPKKRQ